MNTSTAARMSIFLMDVPDLPSEDETTHGYSDPDEPIIRLKVEKRNHLPARRSSAEDSQMSGLSPGSFKKIKQEIDSGDLDLRVVMMKCRGLKPGTSRFFDAYLAGRIETLGQNRQHQTGIPHIMFMDEWNTVMPTLHNMDAMSLKSTPKNPFAIIHLGDLVKFFGPWLAVMLASQFYVSWVGSGWIDQFLEGGRSFYAVLVGLMFFTADSTIWFYNQGKSYKSFKKPGLLILTASLLSSIVLLIMSKITHLI